MEFTCVCNHSFFFKEYILTIRSAFQRELRESIPWDALLYVYATLFVPTIFLLLIGVNLGVWVDNRINYQFIFGMFTK